MKLIFSIFISLFFSQGLYAVAPLSAEQKREFDNFKQGLIQRSSGLVSDGFNRRLERAAREVDREDYDRAIELLEGLVASLSSGSYEKALALQNLGFAHIQNDNLATGAKILQKSLSMESLPYGPTMNVMFALAQIHLANSNNNEALKILRKWFYINDNISPEANMVKGAVYAELNHYQEALRFVEKALASSDEPREAWLSFAAGLYYQNQQYQKAADVLIRLVEVNPRERRYWQQLAGIYSELENDERALSSLILKSSMNLLETQTDYFNLCLLYNYNDLPAFCARLMSVALDKGVIEDKKRALKMLAQAQLQAKDDFDAVKTFDELHQLTNDVQYLAQIGLIYYRHHDWKKTIDYLNRVVGEDSLGKTVGANVALALGISQYQQGHFLEAIKTFSLLEKYENFKSHASAWVSQVERKLKYY